jgi:predicted ATPase/class 3 adenylate cyclase
MIGASELPAGVVTFLFTDIEGSTRLLERHPREYAQALLRHDELMRSAVVAGPGVVFETIGDAVYAAFETAGAAVRCALMAQLQLRAEDWGELPPIRVRMAIHAGEVEIRGSHYFGPALYRCARLLALGHGGQTLVSRTIVDAVRDQLPAGVVLHPMGRHHLKDIAEPQEVYQLQHPGLSSDFPPLRSLVTRSSNLPIFPTSFVGRAGERAAVERLLTTHRFVTLTGPGGVGKTRLALQAATDSLAAFDDGVWFVSLASLVDPALVPSAIAQVFGLAEQSAAPIIEGLRQHVRSREALLIIDTFEHLVEAAMTLSDLSAAGPRLKILVTSRVPLHIAGEQLFVVPPLAALAGSDAVDLFAQRALAVYPQLALDDTTLETIRRICARVDGLPLAIELAASRARVLSPAAILARLEEPLGLLRGAPVDAPARQQSLRSTIEWSHGLLRPHDQELFQDLAVFSGGFDLDAASAVASMEEGDVLEGLTELVDQSLLRSETRPDGEPRFTMLDTIRDYAWSRLTPGRTGALRERHAGHFLELVEQASSEYGRRESRKSFNALDIESDNIRAALRWLDDTRQNIRLARAAIALDRYWSSRGRLREGLHWADAALAREAELPEPALADLLSVRGGLVLFTGDPVVARGYYERALVLRERIGDQAKVAASLTGLGDVAYQSKDYAAAEELFTRSLTINESLGLGDEAAVDRDALGYAVRDAGQLARAATLFELGLARAREKDDLPQLAHAEMMLGELLYMRDQFDRAEPHLAESVEIGRRLKSSWLVAVGQANRAVVAVERGRLREAREMCADAIRAIADSDAVRAAVACLLAAAAVAAAEGRTRAAGRSVGASAAIGDFALGPFAPARERAIARAIALIPVAAFDAYVVEGQRLSRELALAEALAELGGADATITHTGAR